MFCHFSILLKITIKKIVSQLEKHMLKTYPHFNAKFYSNRRNNSIHLGLDISLFSFEDYKTFLKEIESFLNQQLRSKFTEVYPPKLVISTEWKHDYIVRSFNG